MSRLFVPLDVDFTSDPKIAKAGPAAAYLYIVSLAHCKRTMTDGYIHETQLPYLAVGMRNVSRLVDALTTTGLWHKAHEGWQIPSWNKHNASGDEIQTRRQMARDDGIRGAHARWHIPPEGNPSPKCPICVREYKKARGSDGVPHRGAQKGAIAKEEKEPQVEKEPEEEPEAITEFSTSLREAMPDGVRLGAVVNYLADRFRMDDTA